MSMIGLLTGAPQATGSKAKADGTAASGFGTALQGELDALTEAGHHTGETDAAAELATLAQLADTQLTTLPGSATPETPLPASTMSLTPLGPTPPVPDGTPASAGHVVESETLASSPSPSAAPTTLVEHAATVPGTSTPASANSATGPGAASGSPLVQIVGTPTGSSAPASAPTPLAPLAENPPSGSAPAQTGSATGSSPATVPEPGATPTPLAPLAETTPSNSTPASTSTATGLGTATASGAVTVHASGTAAISPAPLAPTSPVLNDAPASAGRAVGSETATGNTPSASINSSTSPAQASGSTTAATPATPVAAPVAASVSTPVQASVAAPAPAPAVPFATQLARPIFSLAATGTGDHVMTLSVTPDSLGPVTVRAHVGADGVRVELFAPNDLGRDAIRAIIPDLRRDLAGAGLGGNLSLSSQNQPTADGSSHGSSTGQPGERATDRNNSSGDRSVASENPETTREQAVDRAGQFGTISTIDVLA